MRLKIFVIILLFSASPAYAESPPISKIYDYGYDVVWDSLVSALTAGSYEIAVIEKDSGVLTTKPRALASGYNANNTMDQVSYLPSIPFSIWTRGEAELSFKASSLGSKQTRVNVLAKYKTYEDGVTKSWYDCPSNGKNETLILEDLGKKIIEQKENLENSKTTNDQSENSQNDSLSKLERLASLKKQGVLTDEEFQSQKRKILDS